MGDLPQTPRLRFEAGPFGWDDLTPDQRKALKRASSLLQQMANNNVGAPIPDEGTETARGVFDSARNSNVVFFDGGRGSGKTSVFLTLLLTIDPRLTLERAEKPPRNVQGGEPKDWPAELRTLRRECLDEHREYVFRTLEIVDLHPLPRTTNLYLFLLGRFHAIIREIEKNLAAVAPHAAWQTKDGGPRELASRTAWRKFVRAVAEGWGADLQARSARVDLEQFTIELEMATQQGIELGIAFRRFLDALARDYEAHKKERPFFVMPIDDADMNPIRAAEVLDLIRNLWHPRLAFVMTGHTELFLHALRVHYLASLRAAFRELPVSDRELQAVGLRTEPVMLAEQVYARVIPPAHRCRLTSLSARERLPESATWSGLRRILGQLAFMVRGERRSLLEYFERYTFTREALPWRLRDMQDLEATLAEYVPGQGESLEGRERERAVAQAILRIWHDACLRSALGPWERSEIKTIIVERSSGDGFTVNSEKIQWKRPTHVLHHATQEISRLRMQRPLDPEAVIPGEHDQRFGLPKTITASLMLAVDMATDLERSHLVGPSPAPRAFEGSFVIASRWSTTLGRSIEVAWPLPDWPAFADFEQFSESWEKAVVATSRPRLTQLVGFFLSLAVAICDRLDRPSFDPTSEPNLTEVGKKLADLASRTEISTRGEAVYAWATGGAPLLTAPEFGLSPVDRKALLTGIRMGLTAGWDEMAESLIEQRNNRLRAMATQRDMGPIFDDVESILEKLKRELNGKEKKAWDEWVRQPAAIDSDLPLEDDPLEAAFSRVPVKVEPDYYGQWQPHRGLATYLDTPERRELARDIGATRVNRAVLLASAGADPREVLDAIAGDAPADAIEPIPTALIRESQSDLDLGPVVFQRVRIQTERGLVPRVRADLDADCSGISWWTAGHEPSLWPGLLSEQTNVDNQAVWPCVAWRSLLEWELLITAWNSWRTGIQRNLSGYPFMVDLLAYRFVDACVTVAYRRAPSSYRSDGWSPTEIDWHGMMKMIAERGSGATHGPRWHAFNAWRLSLHKLTLPAAGLSDGARETIEDALDAWPESLRHKKP